MGPDRRLPSGLVLSGANNYQTWVDPVGTPMSYFDAAGATIDMAG